MKSQKAVLMSVIVLVIGVSAAWVLISNFLIAGAALFLIALMCIKYLLFSK